MYCSQFCGGCGNKLAAPAPQQPVYAPPPLPVAPPAAVYQAPPQPVYPAPQPGYGAPVQPMNYPAAGYVPSHMGLAIFTTLCCCIPLGLIAIIYAAQVKGRLAAGDMAGAQRAASSAKMWAILGIIGGVIVIVISILVQAVRQGMIR